jgi:hypothetical protein
VASRRAAAAVFIAYNLLLALLWAPHNPVFAAAHLAATALPTLLASTPFADAYPAFAVIGIWTEMGAVLPLLHPDGAAAREAAALWLDGLLFGTHWHTEWIARMPWAWLSSDTVRSSRSRRRCSAQAIRSGRRSRARTPPDR